MDGMTYGVDFTDPTRVIKSVTAERSYEPVELWYGSELRRFWSSTGVTVGIEMEDSQSSGIEPVLGGSGKLDSVGAQYVEVTNPIPEIPRYPGQDMPDDERLMKAYAAAVRWLGRRSTFTIAGQGEAVWDLLQGTSAAGIEFESSDGTFTITLPTGAKIEKVGRSLTNENKAHTWTGEVFGWYANTGDKSTNIIEVPTELGAYIPDNCIYVVTDNYTMSGDYTQNNKHTVSLQCSLTV